LIWETGGVGENGGKVDNSEMYEVEVKGQGETCDAK